MEGFRELIELHLAEQEERDARKQQEKLKAKIAELDEQLSGARQKLAAAEERRDAQVAERRRLEQEVADLDASRTKYRTQLMEAKTNEVYRTLLSEIENAGKMISEKETQILERMELIDTVEEAVAAARAELETAEGESAGEAAKMQADVESLEVERAQAREKADALREKVPKRLLPTYDRIYKGRDSKALALCIDHTCTECQMAVRPQVWVEILREDKIHNCGGCGRILYREESVQTVPAGGDDPGSPAEGA
jgi:predicted  nucleic acid-binding Zn-ribbon protein